MSIIDDLKQNTSAFGLMPEEMQEKAREIGQPEFEMYMKNDTWLSCGSIDNFSGTSVTDMTYRLRPDYKEEGVVEGVVKCEVNIDGCNNLYCLKGLETKLIPLVSSDPDFIGYRYEDGKITTKSRRYIDTKHQLLTEVLMTMDKFPAHFKVLTPTHVLFRGVK